jgi:acyl-CoA synthetase (AMP-forming)/AMP-acid ligase II
LLYPEETAFKYGSRLVPFSEFNSRVNRLIHGLQSLGVKKGEVLGVLSWNCLEYTDVYGAAMKGGYIASPYNARLQSAELDYLINYSEASTVFVGPELVQTINSLRSRLPRVRNFISFRIFSRHDSYDDLLRSHSEGSGCPEEEDPLFIFYTSEPGCPSRGTVHPWLTWMIPGDLVKAPIWNWETYRFKSCPCSMWAHKEPLSYFFVGATK